MSVIGLAILIGLALLIPTAYAAKIGAPYAPTRLPAVRQAFDFIDLGEDDTLVDLGAGDGSILIEAAKRGASTTGYELSPIMWAIIWLRIRKYKNITLRFANFYKQKLPQSTTMVFSFLMPENMGKVKKFLAAQKLPHAKFFLSYAFPLPETEPLHIVQVKNCARLYVYDLRSIVSP